MLVHTALQWRQHYQDNVAKVVSILSSTIYDSINRLVSSPCRSKCEISSTQIQKNVDSLEGVALNRRHRSRVTSKLHRIICTSEILLNIKQDNLSNRQKSLSNLLMNIIRSRSGHNFSVRSRHGFI